MLNVTIRHRTPRQEAVKDRIRIMPFQHWSSENKVIHLGTEPSEKEPTK
jgi:hypothetical protein